MCCILRFVRRKYTEGEGAPRAWDPRLAIPHGPAWPGGGAGIHLAPGGWFGPGGAPHLAAPGIPPPGGAIIAAPVGLPVAPPGGPLVLPPGGHAALAAPFPLGGHFGAPGGPPPPRPEGDLVYLIPPDFLPFPHKSEEEYNRQSVRRRGGKNLLCFFIIEIKYAV